MWAEISRKWVTLREKITENNLTRLTKMWNKQHSISRASPKITFTGFMSFKGKSCLRQQATSQVSSETLTLTGKLIQAWMPYNRKSIDNYWNVDDGPLLSDPWIGVTRFTVLNKRPLYGHMWVGNRLTKKKVTSRPGNICPKYWSPMSKRVQRQAKEAWEKRKATITWCNKEKRWIYEIPNDDHEFDDIMRNARRKLESRIESAMLSKCFLFEHVSNPKKDDLERGGKLLAIKWEGFEKEGFNTSSSIHDHKEAAIEARRPRVEESKGRKHQDHIADRGQHFFDTLQLGPQAYFHPTSDEHTPMRKRQYPKNGNSDIPSWRQKIHYTISFLVIITFLVLPKIILFYIIRLGLCRFFFTLRDSVSTFFKDWDGTGRRWPHHTDQSLHLSRRWELNTDIHQITLHLLSRPSLGRCFQIARMLRTSCKNTSGTERRSRTAKDQGRRLSYHMDKSTKIKTSEKLGLKSVVPLDRNLHGHPWQVCCGSECWKTDWQKKMGEMFLVGRMPLFSSSTGVILISLCRRHQNGWEMGGFV